jgi:uncharacterized circularly permuted ATP-grasp superfamily protein/uncharacterized alpha-E superfamily protein
MSDASLDQTPAAGESPLSQLLPDYAVPAGHFDELLRGSGTLRSYWERFASLSGELTADYLAQAQKRVARQIDENGVTYNVYAMADGPSRPWSLDVLPLLIAGSEWEQLARGLRQRARLLNAIAADLYGGQLLLREGLIPPALVYRHPGFLRGCHGTRPADSVFLHLVAFDLARGPDGGWRVVGTRTQAPSGFGYALENRAIMSRVFPDAFRSLHTHPLWPFFQSLRETLLASAPAEGESPHVVLLTPGPFNETYFEHAYLARQLGFPLVEGGDLTVRQDRVFLKTVAGLRPVHAILRRLDDDYCDPLELRPESTLGIPGLVQAWRAGHVLVANAFGMGVLESPALLAFLPPICERLLGEGLETSALATWWCGEAAALADVRRRLAEGVIKPAFANAAMEPVFASALDARGRGEWADRLGTGPDRYVVEEFLPLSHAPVWCGDRVESRAFMLRVFLLTDGRGDYQLMPGGLSRIAGADRQVVSGQRGGGSKDTWVLSSVALDSAPPAERRARGREVAAELTTSSRAAENLFWLGRYAERSENSARLLRAVLGHVTDDSSFSGGLRPAFLRACERQQLLNRPEPERGLEARSSDRDVSAMVRELIEGIVDRRSRRSLGFNVEQTVRVAGAVRDRLSTDNWRLLNRLMQLFNRSADARADLDDALELVDDSLVSLVAVGGLEMAHMTRDDGWRFLSLGRHLERLRFVATTVEDVALNQASADSASLEWLLELSDSLLTYRVRHMQYPEWQSVVDLVVFDERHPRSARFQLAKLAKHVRLLPDANLSELVGEIDGLLAACSAGDREQGELFGQPQSIDHLLAGCERLANRVSDALTLRYFSHVAEVSRATVAV